MKAFVRSRKDDVCCEFSNAGFRFCEDDSKVSISRKSNVVKQRIHEVLPGALCKSSA